MSSGIESNNMLAYLHEPERESRGMEGKPGSEIDIEFEIKVKRIIFWILKIRMHVII